MLLVHGSCDSGTTVEPPDTRDAGTRDAGLVRDAGVVDRDGGVEADAGIEADAGASDAGIPRDGGTTPRDGGTETCSVSGVSSECADVTGCGGEAIFRNICSGVPARSCCFDAVDPCSVDGAPGLCLDTAECNAPYVSTAGRCPGAANIQCCTNPADACDPMIQVPENQGLQEVVYDANCPAGMVRVTDFCIDRYEASLVQMDGTAWSPYHKPTGVRVRAVSLELAVPQGYISQTDAAAACAEAGKRLCTDTEWLRACRGSNDFVYPYGNTREDGRCNDARARHPAIEYFGTSDNWIWSEIDNACINQIPNALALTGQHADCETESGAFDMMGNLHEWTADPSGTFRGGFYTDTRINGEGCQYRTTAHSTGHWDYSTGFRCCAD